MRMFVLIALCSMLGGFIACTADSSGVDAAPDPDALSSEECPETCENIPPEGACVNGWVIKCGNDRGVCTDCAAANQQCIYNPLLATTSCEDLDFVVPDCLPRCEGKSCGGDGCGGSCGFCPASGICDGSQCHLPGEPCGDIPTTGACLGNAVATCVNDGLQYLDCTPLLRKCDYNSATGKFECVLP